MRSAHVFMTMLFLFGSSNVFSAQVNERLLWETNIIPICFEDMSPDQAEWRQEVRSILEQTWQQASSILFTGWGGCSTGSMGIRIGYTTSGMAHAMKTGNKINGLEGGIKLYRLVTRDVVHEFGHALSFGHDQHRTDSSCPDEDPRGIRHSADDTRSKNIYFGPEDINSIMSYCRSSDNQDLTELDKRAINAFYPKKLNPETALDRYYAFLFGHVPDEYESVYQYRKSKIVSGGCSTQSLRETIWEMTQDNEFSQRVMRTNNPDDSYTDRYIEGKIESLYRAAFNRLPDQPGMKAWLAIAEQEGNSFMDVVHGVIYSSEFASRAIAPADCRM